MAGESLREKHVLVGGRDMFWSKVLHLQNFGGATCSGQKTSTSQRSRTWTRIALARSCLCLLTLSLYYVTVYQWRVFRLQVFERNWNLERGLHVVEQISYTSRYTRSRKYHSFCVTSEVQVILVVLEQRNKQYNTLGPCTTYVFQDVKLCSSSSCLSSCSIFI